MRPLQSCTKGNIIIYIDLKRVTNWATESDGGGLTLLTTRFERKSLAQTIQNIHQDFVRSTQNIYLKMFDDITGGTKKIESKILIYWCCEMSYYPTNKHYSSRWALASSTIRLHATRSFTVEPQPITLLARRSPRTWSIHLSRGLHHLLVAYTLAFIIFFNIVFLHSLHVVKPSEYICDFMNLTTSSWLRISLISLLFRIRHSASFTLSVPYILRITLRSIFSVFIVILSSVSSFCFRWLR